jgi:hypothetical protein
VTSREFCYWLQGYIEITGDPPPLTAAQVDVIRRHLAMVFVHEIDPSYPQKGVLDKLHDPKANFYFGPSNPGFHFGPSNPGDAVMRC